MSMEASPRRCCLRRPERARGRVTLRAAREEVHLRVNDELDRLVGEDSRDVASKLFGELKRDERVGYAPQVHVVVPERVVVRRLVDDICIGSAGT